MIQSGRRSSLTAGMTIRFTSHSKTADIHLIFNPPTSSKTSSQLHFERLLRPCPASITHQIQIHPRTMWWAFMSWHTQERAGSNSLTNSHKKFLQHSSFFHHRSRTSRKAISKREGICFFFLPFRLPAIWIQNCSDLRIRRRISVSHKRTHTHRGGKQAKQNWATSSSQGKGERMLHDHFACLSLSLLFLAFTTWVLSCFPQGWQKRQKRKERISGLGASSSSSIICTLRRIFLSLSFGLACCGSSF